jgi:hypothetical protein
MHKDKEENAHHDSHYRARELAALAAYDHQHLDGEMFLQVRKVGERLGREGREGVGREKGASSTKYRQSQSQSQSQSPDSAR